jgi:hypothetical protein
LIFDDIDIVKNKFSSYNNLGAQHLMAGIAAAGWNTSSQP